MLPVCRARAVQNRLRRDRLRRQRIEILRRAYHDDMEKVTQALRSNADASTHSHNDWVEVVSSLIRDTSGVDLVEADINPSDLRMTYARGYSAEEAVKILLDTAYEL